MPLPTGPDAENNFRVSCSYGFCHHLFKTEHAAAIFIVFLFSGFGIMGIRVMAVKKLDDMETAFIDIEMDVPCLKIRCASFPDFCARICYFFS